MSSRLRTTCVAFVATTFFALSHSTPASASAIDFLGATVRADYAWPDTTSILYNGGTRVVGAGIEFQDLEGLGNGNPTVDFSATEIDFTFALPWGIAGMAPFDGLRFSVVSGAPAISGVSIAGTNLAGFDASRVTFDATTVYANLSGLSELPAGSFVSLQVTFDQPVPEPTVVTMLVLGCGAMITRRWRHRRRD